MLLIKYYLWKRCYSLIHYKLPKEKSFFYKNRPPPILPVKIFDESLEINRVFDENNLLLSKILEKICPRNLTRKSFCSGVYYVCRCPAFVRRSCLSSPPGKRSNAK